MSILKQLVIKDNAAPLSIEYPGIEGFEVQLALISKESLMKIRDKATIKKLNKARQYEDSVDTDLFFDLWTKKAIRGWTGLKIKHLPKLLPVDISQIDPEKEVPYTEEDALDLMRNSSVFDQWVTEQLNNFEQFSVEKREEDVKN